MGINFLALIILFVAAFADLLVPVVLGLKYPGYNHFLDTISILGAKGSPVKKQENLNLVMIGILLIVFSFLQRLAFTSSVWSHSLYTLGIIVFGIGCIVAGIFPGRAKGVGENFSGKIHDIASGTGFIFFLFSPLWASFIDVFAKYRAFNIIFFTIGIVSFALFILSENKETGLLKYTGLFQRLNLLVLYGCLLFNCAVLTIKNF